MNIQINYIDHPYMRFRIQGRLFERKKKLVGAYSEMSSYSSVHGLGQGEVYPGTLDLGETDPHPAQARNEPISAWPLV